MQPEQAEENMQATETQPTTDEATESDDASSSEDTTASEDSTASAPKADAEQSAQAEDAAPAEPEAPAKPVNEKARWYIVHAYSGFEKKVAQQIQEKAAQHNMTNKIVEVTVPIEEVVEVRKGKKVNTERKFFPGYVLVKMELTDETWHLVKNTQKVTGFLGGGGKPMPISQREVDDIFAQIKEGIEHPKHSVTYEIGETVKVNDGPFASFTGSVEGVDEDKARLKVAVSIFGRSTPVELEYAQVEKI